MSSLELFKAILDGHMHIKTGAKRKAKTAVNRARKIIEEDPKVVRTAIFEIEEIIDEIPDSVALLSLEAGVVGLVFGIAQNLYGPVERLTNGVGGAGGKSRSNNHQHENNNKE